MRGMFLLRPLPAWRAVVRHSPGQNGIPIQVRRALSGYAKTTDLYARVTAPNGREYTQPLGLFIDNEFVRSKSGDTIVSINPSTDQEIISVQAAGPADVDHAVATARRAFQDPTWRDLHPSSRRDLLLRLVQLIEEHASTLATIETWDNGKPYLVSLQEDIPDVIRTFKYYAGWADKISGQVFHDGTLDKLAYTLREPIGVCGQIIPWNYPLGMAAWKLAPALACGNTVVLKAAEQTPLSILYLATLVREAGFPSGVINLLNGLGPIAGRALARHQDIDKISFTGSTPTGIKVMKFASDHPKEIQLETGGKSAAIIFEDADLKKAVQWSYIGSMSNSGQICSATSRILVQEGIYDRFLEMFIKHVESKTIMGEPFHEKTTHGPLVSKKQYERVQSFIEEGIEEGATLCTPSIQSSPGKSTQNEGNFIPPQIFTNISPSMKIWHQEIFGPVVCVVPFRDEKQAIHLANDTTRYGLAAAIFTRDITRAHRLVRGLDVGTVWVNSSNDVMDPRIPFGGVKESGFGRELGEDGLRGYSRVKGVNINLGN
ncbi:MAG: hypothetical protein M1823_003886 [Watsoniomyces obsoletus]|nr:MAG: hypothetical protein M1823_003886 [Watsoniomyces obsoletus]